MHYFFLFALLGLVSGFFGGLLGIGGGSMVVPILYFLLKPLGLGDAELMHVVIGTTFAAMFFNTAISVIFHHRDRNILWGLALILLPALILGPIGGSYVAASLEGKILRVCFTVFQLLTSVYFLMPLHKPVEVVGKAPHPILTNIVTFVIGGIGSILGIGGGILMVPFFDMMGLRIKKAIGTSSFTSCVMLLVSALSFLFLGLENSITLPYHIGYIYLPAFVVIGFFSMVAAPFGVKLVHLLPTQPLKKIFAVAMAILAILLLID